MAIKGTTKIELTDVHTGKKQIVEKTNMVTNAISDILSYNPFGFKFFDTYLNGVKLSSLLSPICPNAIGGVLLYGDPLEEDPDKYYADISNPVVGYANTAVNSTNDQKRGSINLEESGKLDGGLGYRFVFDFATSQGNGTFSALGLTSKQAGAMGNGSNYVSAQTNILGITSLLSTINEKYDVPTTDRDIRYMTICALDPEKNYAYFARAVAANTIEVGKFSFPLTSMSAFRTLPDFTLEPIDTQMITTQTFHSSFADGDADNYSTFIDGGDGYIWGLQHANNANGNASGSATVLWIKINKEDYTFEEGTWTIDGQLLAFGAMRDLVKGSRYGARKINNAIIKNGVLYAIKYTSNSYMYGVYAIPLDNPTNITLMPTPNNVGYSFVVPNDYSYQSTTVNDVAGVVSYMYLYIENGELHKKANTIGHDLDDQQGLCRTARPSLKCGPYLIGLCCYTAGTVSYKTLYANIYLPTCYLATINNLPNAITKTASQTMKITYTISEEPDE